jgi:quercetin dioxygenase-like cupin family protein
MTDKFFPEIITKLPEAEISLPGVQAFLAQAGNQQFYFMIADADVESPVHKHEAQWGVVLDGELELTIDEKKKVLKKGDTYLIPENVAHHALIKKGYKGLMLIDKKDRYKVKK